MRDEFSQSVKDNIAKRVGNRCSNPYCRNITSGPQENPAKSINVGVASHITAASPEGPRYDDTLTPEKRESSENGIWLCQNCAKLIDNDVKKFPVEKLYYWKKRAEEEALSEIKGGPKQQVDPRNLVFQNLEENMGDLLEEMRQDLTKYPLRREIILLKKEWRYNSSDGLELIYYYNDHPELDNKMRILENYHLVKEITYNNTKRYIFSEELVAYLLNK